MKSRIKKGLAAAAAIMSATAVLFVGNAGSGTAQPSGGLPAFGLIGDGTLMCAFTTNQPGVLNWVRVVQGLSGDARLIGIDIRVQDGKLYAVGDQGGIYTITVNPDPNFPYVTTTKVSQLQIGLLGKNFGVDFNPAADRLRVVSDTGQNLRHNLNDHTTVKDADLTTPPTPGATLGVTAAAYTNNDLNPATVTTLFDLNTNTDQVVIQSPANNGTLAPTGSLTVDAVNAGFDIFSDLTNGKTKSVTGFATLVTSSGSATFNNINLFTGEATPVGAFPLPVTDIAVSLDTN